jgi:muramoyltetrapeptide carboxypeptidase
MNAKLKVGDEIRVIAPSMSWSKGRDPTYRRAQRRLESLGYHVSFGTHVKSAERFGTGAVADRLADLHAA